MSAGERIVQAATVCSALAAILVASVGLNDRFGNKRLPTERNGTPVKLADWRKFAASGQRAGPADGLVTIIEFGDYECPACKSAEPHLEAVRRQYSDRVTFVYRHWPLSYHRYALPAARAAECAAAQGRFWEFHKQLFTDDNWLGDAMVRFAKSAEVVDLRSFRECIESNTRVERIESDIAAAKLTGARGTPAIFINGVLHESEVDSISLSTAIDQLLVASTGGRR